jgi:hypothetical protein
MLNDLPVGVDYTKRRKTWRKKGKCPKLRFIRIWLQGVLPQRVKRLRKTFIVFMVNDLHLWIDYTERRKTERKKENVPNQHS